LTNDWHDRRPDLSWHAIDGALNIETYTHGLVAYHDICGPWPMEWDRDFPGGGFSWIVSLEMAEHIRPSCEGNFFALLRQARHGVLLSWSEQYIPGIHQNARRNSYVIGVMRQAGFLFEQQQTTEARALLHTSIRNNFMVFTRVAS